MEAAGAVVREKENYSNAARAVTNTKTSNHNESDIDGTTEEINRIKELRKNNPEKRIEELGKDLDKDAISISEGEAGFEIEEKFGYFQRFRSTSERKGDWASISGEYRNKTFDEFGGEISEMALSEFARKTSQKKKFFKSLDLHFEKADFVVLNLTKMKKLNQELYSETIEYIFKKHGSGKLINITK